jgi:hypothetical protein
MDRAKVDPALRAALATAKAGRGTVDAVVTLAPSDPAIGVDSPAETVKKGRALVARVRAAVGTEPDAVNVFENLQSMAVSADASFIEELISQPEVNAAMANRVVSAPRSAPRTAPSPKRPSPRGHRSRS